VPRTVPRGSVQVPQGSVFTALGRTILDRLDRGVVLLDALGRSVEETAQALDLSLNTVRTHLKHIFTKCEVNSQAELLHLLAMGPHEL